MHRRQNPRKERTEGTQLVRTVLLANHGSRKVGIELTAQAHHEVESHERAKATNAKIAPTSYSGKVGKSEGDLRSLYFFELKSSSFKDIHATRFSLGFFFQRVNFALPQLLFLSWLRSADLSLTGFLSNERA